MSKVKHYDVVIIGAGLAGLSLARHLLLETDKKILLLDRRAEVPSPKQKVGEATVQLSAYYFSKVLDLEEHLLREHFMKYNLRFFWKTEGSACHSYEDYSQSYIRNLSNIASYQLDRNKLEAELLRLNLEGNNFEFRASVEELDVTLSEEGSHALSFKAGGRKVRASAAWVVDASGRGKFLARRLGLARQNPIRHGAHFFWVDGLVNIEKLTELSPQGVRLRRDRSALGHLPVWLATNHFCGEGFWFWVIPLQGKTSLGLVYDNETFPRERVSTLEKLIEWVCDEFPLFARDLPNRRVLHHTALKDFSYDCAQTISSSRWALSGESGRFTDPLYSPGGDLISLHNTFIVDAIKAEDDEELAGKCRLYEQTMKSLYEAYVPSYAVSYDVLGDQESMTLKYSWELTVYFAFYVFPFINDLFTERRFLISYLNRFSKLGPLNKNLQTFIHSYHQWKKGERRPSSVLHTDFMEVGSLRNAEKTFYEVGVSIDEAVRVLDGQLANLEEMARFITAHIAASVLGDSRAMMNRAFVESLEPARLQFDPEELRKLYAACEGLTQKYRWSFDASVLWKFVEGGLNSPSECEGEMLVAVGGDR